MPVGLTADYADDEDVRTAKFAKNANEDVIPLVPTVRCALGAERSGGISQDQPQITPMVRIWAGA